MIGSPTFSPSLRNDRSLYIHVPFCRHRCGYCNFALVAGRDDLIERYLNALKTEIEWLSGRHYVKTIFLGGGTPSHLSPSHLQRLFEIIRSRFEFDDSCEISIECNPNDLNLAKAEALATCGVNRVSFGVQSFNEQKLKFLERTHNRDDVAAAVKNARSFTNNFSFDLIFATASESLDTWHSDLATAFAFSPKHISTYELTIEKGTQFWNRHQIGVFKVPDQEQRADHYLHAIEQMQQRGFHHYEISSFCRPGHECRHNSSYWNGTEYFAFGPGSARFIDVVRETNHRSTTHYLKKMESNRSPVADRQVMTPLEIAMDQMVFGLRQLAGVDVQAIEEKVGVEIATIGSQNSILFENELLELDSGTLKLTTRGLLLYDAIAAELLSSAG